MAPPAPKPGMAFVVYIGKYVRGNEIGGKGFGMSRTEAVLRVELAHAGYAGREAAVRDVRFSVGAGETVGLIGPNGAGKSTTLKAIIGLIDAAQGAAEFCGPRGTYAYVPEQPVFHEDLTLWEHICFAAAAHGLDEAEALARAERLLEKFRMTDAAHRLPGSFSKGMQQKMMLTLGYLLEPDVYIVDEPFLGLDPRAVRDLLALFAEERRRGAGVLLCTHVLDTAEKICDSFLLMNGGAIVARGTLADIRAQAGLADGDLYDCFDALT